MSLYSTPIWGLNRPFDRAPIRNSPVYLNVGKD